MDVTGRTESSQLAVDRLFGLVAFRHFFADESGDFEPFRLGERDPRHWARQPIDRLAFAVADVGNAVFAHHHLALLRGHLSNFDRVHRFAPDFEGTSVVPIATMRRREFS